MKKLIINLGFILGVSTMVVGCTDYLDSDYLFEERVNIENVFQSKETGEKMLVTQYEGSVIEDTGLIKMDFLGLKTLSIIKEAKGNFAISSTRVLSLQETVTKLSHFPVTST